MNDLFVHLHLFKTQSSLFRMLLMMQGNEGQRNEKGVRLSMLIMVYLSRFILAFCKSLPKYFDLSISMCHLGCSISEVQPLTWLLVSCFSDILMYVGFVCYFDCNLYYQWFISLFMWMKFLDNM